MSKDMKGNKVDIQLNIIDSHIRLLFSSLKRGATSSDELKWSCVRRAALNVWMYWWAAFQPSPVVLRFGPALSGLGLGGNFLRSKTTKLTDKSAIVCSTSCWSSFFLSETSSTAHLLSRLVPS